MPWAPLPRLRSVPVLPAEIRAGLDRFVARARKGGATALFWGPSGAGRRMAARVAARELGWDLLQVDVGPIVNKYLGETEKNLAKLLDAAERMDAVLLLDEADDLFGERESGRLIARIEERGRTAILSTSRKVDVDPAFLRRLHAVIHFPDGKVSGRGAGTPEHHAPGVFVEEISHRAPSIVGVSTAVTGFVGQARYGPVDAGDEVLANLGEFERRHGDGQQLRFGGVARHDYLWHAARAFFAEGGKRLHVCRVFRRLDDSPARPAPYLGPDGTCTLAPYADGHARGRLATAGPGAPLEVWARHPGAAGSGTARFTFTVGKNVLTLAPGVGGGAPVATGLQHRDVVLIPRRPAAPGWATAAGPFHLASREADGTWSFTENPAAAGPRFPLGQIAPTEIEAGLEIRVVSVDVTFQGAGGTWTANECRGLPLDPARRTTRPDVPVLIRDAAVSDGLELLRLFLQAGAARAVPLEAAIQDAASAPESRSVILDLDGGNDGQEALAQDFEGKEFAGSERRTGLKGFEQIPDLSIVAAPGATHAGTPPGDPGLAADVARVLIAHCEQMRYRIALVDPCNGMTIQQVQDLRATFDSKHAALYYPWIQVDDPVTRQLIALPPSGFVAGIYARNDAQRAVHKAPANEVVGLARGFEVAVNMAQQEVLNPLGINVFRFFEGRGHRLWGARTASSDPEWKYVNVRRYFDYLERSIEVGTEWVAFEPSGEPLWANVRRTVEDFLRNEWEGGGLLGARPEDAYFVRCDRSTMTQDDLDRGRLVCLVGVAPLRPAEFIIFRIGQWTADHR